MQYLSFFAGSAAVAATSSRRYVWYIFFVVSESIFHHHSLSILRWCFINFTFYMLFTPAMNETRRHTKEKQHRTFSLLRKKLYIYINVCATLYFESLTFPSVAVFSASFRTSFQHNFLVLSLALFRVLYLHLLHSLSIFFSGDVYRNARKSFSYSLFLM